MAWWAPLQSSPCLTVTWTRPPAPRSSARSRTGAQLADSAPWQMRTSRNRVAILAAVVIGVAVVLFLIALLVIG